MTQSSVSLAVLSTATILFFWGRDIDKGQDKKSIVTYISYVLFIVGIAWFIDSFQITLR